MNQARTLDSLSSYFSPQTYPICLMNINPQPDVKKAAEWPHRLKYLSNSFNTVKFKLNNHPFSYTLWKENCNLQDSPVTLLSVKQQFSILSGLIKLPSNLKNFFKKIPTWIHFNSVKE